MERKRVRTLLMASVTIMLCMALLIGGTYALWSKTVSVNNHLVAGNLDLKLERIVLSKTMLDNETGYMIEKAIQTEEDAPVDLTTGSDVNVFGIEESELVVPTSCYEAKMRLTNNGSVAFKYQIVIKLIEVDKELAEQLMVSVNGVENGYLSTFDAQDGQVVVTSTDASAVEKGQATTFRVKVEFKDDSAEGVTSIINNAAMNKKVDFDLIVKAVQLTSGPNSTSNGD